MISAKAPAMQPDIRFASISGKNIW